MALELTVKAGGSFDLHEADEWIDATIIDIQDDPDGKFGPQLKWILHVDGDDQDRETWAFCSQTLSPSSKLYAWLNAGFYDLGVGQTVVIEDLIGDRCQVMFEQYQRDAEGGAYTAEKVVKIRAPKGGREKKPIAKPKATVPDDDAPF